MNKRFVSLCAVATVLEFTSAASSPAATTHSAAFFPFRGIQQLVAHAPASQETIEDSVLALRKIDQRNNGEIFGLGNNVTPTIRSQVDYMSNRAGLFAIVREAGMDDNAPCAYVNKTRCFTGFLSVLTMQSIPNIYPMYQLCLSREDCEYKDLIYRPPLEKVPLLKSQRLRIAIVFEFLNKGPRGRLIARWLDKDDFHIAVLAKVRRVLIFSDSGRLLLDDREPA